jgi:hypothetical protein
MPRRTPPGFDRIKNRYSEKTLTIPSDFAIIVSTVLALLSAGLIVLVLALLAIIVGLVVFHSD